MHDHGSCPSAESDHCWTAHVVADHSEQGWLRLCNGVILFDDGYFIAPDGHSEPVVLAACTIPTPRRAAPCRASSRPVPRVEPPRIARRAAPHGGRLDRRGGSG